MTLLSCPLFTLDTIVQTRDVEKIRDLVASTHTFRPIEVDIACELVQTHIDGNFSDYSFIFARNEKNNIMGYTCYGEIPLTEKRFDLYWIVVSPVHQGKKIGLTLLQATEKAILDITHSATQMYAETSGTSDYFTAQQFYLKQGFSEIARLTDFYRKGDDKIIYRKLIK